MSAPAVGSAAAAAAAAAAAHGHANSDVFSHPYKLYAHQQSPPWTPVPPTPAPASLTHWIYSVVGSAVSALHLALTLAERLSHPHPPMLTPMPTDHHHFTSMPINMSAPAPVPPAPVVKVEPQPTAIPQHTIRLLHPHPLPVSHPRFTKQQKPAPKPKPPSPKAVRKAKPPSPKAVPKAAPRAQQVSSDAWSDAAHRPKAKSKPVPNDKPVTKPAAAPEPQPIAKVGGKFEPLMDHLYMEPFDEDEDDADAPPSAPSPVSPITAITAIATSGSAGSSGTISQATISSAVQPSGDLPAAPALLATQRIGQKLSASAQPYVPADVPAAVPTDIVGDVKPKPIAPELQAKVQRIQELRKAITRFCPKSRRADRANSPVPSSALILLVASYDGVIPREPYNDSVLAFVVQNMSSQWNSESANCRAEDLLEEAAKDPSDVLQLHPEYVPPPDAELFTVTAEPSYHRPGKYNPFAWINEDDSSAPSAPSALSEPSAEPTQPVPEPVSVPVTIAKSGNRKVRRQAKHVTSAASDEHPNSPVIQHPGHTDIACPMNVDRQRLQELSAAVNSLVVPRRVGMSTRSISASAGFKDRVPTDALTLIIASYDGALPAVPYHKDLLETIISHAYSSPATANALAVEFIETVTSAPNCLNTIRSSRCDSVGPAVPAGAGSKAS